MAKVRGWLAGQFEKRVKVSVAIPTIILQLLLVAVLLAIAFGGVRAFAMGVQAAADAEVIQIGRDLGIAAVAHVLAGDEVPVEIDYTGSMGYDPNYIYGMYSNSGWVAEQVRLIIPFMAYEGLIEQGQYPGIAFWAPKADMQSIHVLGWASTREAQLPVFLNERMLIGPNGVDGRRILGVLVHELIHQQGGAFSHGTNVEREAATQAATIEVLAAMCNYRDELACRAFWYEIEDLARSSLRARMNTSAGYRLIMNVLFRDAEDERSARKSRRFWADKPEQLQYIVKAYGQYPWESHVLPGLRGEHWLNTGNKRWVQVGFQYEKEPLLMRFDDAIDVFGIIRVLAFIR